jgi:hypothetical protein
MSDELARLIQKYREMYEAARPNLGRWVYCKYCHLNTRPDVGPNYDLVVCSRCGYGLAPMDLVCKAGSYKAWHDQLVDSFNSLGGSDSASEAN